ncbi:MAG TPA: GyrI-like domain-containing protein [Solirubrobacteraceae bacterium]
MATDVTIVSAPATPTAVIAQATSWKEFPGLWGDLLGEVWAFVRGNDLSPGRNIMVYKDDVPNVEVGVEVAGVFAPQGRVIPSTLPAGQAAKAISRGAPSPAGIAAAHKAVTDWCAANGHELIGVRWEVYDHWREEDPDSFETEVYWLLSPTRSSAS